MYLENTNPTCEDIHISTRARAGSLIGAVIGPCIGTALLYTLSYLRGFFGIRDTGNVDHTGVNNKLESFFLKRHHTRSSSIVRRQPPTSTGPTRQETQT